MATKVPEKILVNSFLKRIQDADWSTKDNSLLTTDHNTKIVIDALRDSAREAGYMALFMVLSRCKTVKENV